jgi:hypothetical protein
MKEILTAGINELTVMDHSNSAQARWQGGCLAAFSTAFGYANPQWLEKYRHLPLEELGPFKPIMVPTAVPQNLPLDQEVTRGSHASLGSIAAAKLNPDVYLDLGKLRDRLKWYCSVKDQPGLLLRFQEYDRTAAELAGGPYTGEGDREFLGLTVTDEVGNYIFRFSRDLGDIVDELDDQVTGGPAAAGTTCRKSCATSTSRKLATRPQSSTK